MELPSTVYIGAGAVLAAFVSGVFTFVNLVASKEQKTSEFRQMWIDGLREEICNLTSKVNQLTSLLIYYNRSCKSPEEVVERYDKTIHENPNIMGDIAASYNKILLRVNPKEDSEFIKRLNDVYMLHWTGNVPESEEKVEETINALISESQLLLKREWKRVKSGETSYWTTKYMALVVVIALLAGAWHYTRQLEAPSLIGVEKTEPNLQPKSTP